MKLNISRQSLYLLVLSLFLLIFVLLFSFLVLIPEGKDYREKRSELKKENIELQKYQEFYDETLDHLKKIQGANRHIITAFKTPFNADRFEKINKSYFNTLTILPMHKVGNEDAFTVYEVNATSKINSPTVFYNFLDSINKSDWIIGVNFPINFKREADMIRSSFTMKVYTVAKEVAPVSPVSEKKEVIVPVLKEEEKVLIVVTDPDAQVKIKEAAKKEKTVVLVFEDIHFEFDKSTLNKDAKDTLKREISLLNKSPKTRVLVAGYASESGTEEYNQDLSEKRAQSVKDYLVQEKLISADKISTIGYGETRPTQYEVNPSNTDSKAAKANMRVFLEITHK